MLSASLRPRTDWLGAPIGEASALEPSLRDALAQAWLRDARLEHASIASFAKFTLQLLALGAPAELVTAAQQAAMDEVAHAQACFGLASRYAGQALGPGELTMPSTLSFAALAEAAAAAVREGCVAETLAALQAYEQLQHVSDAQARDALLCIATDETRHAAVAYRFVRWALSEDSASVEQAVRDAFASTRAQRMAEAAEQQQDVDVALWHAHGRLTASEQRACALLAWRDVIEPCVRALYEPVAV